MLSTLQFPSMVSIHATSSGIARHTAGTWKCFLFLIDQHFPKSNPLHNIFNQNTIKLSYSCMSNVKSIISSHNKSVIRKSTNSDKDKKNCNCRKPEKCPMDGNCNVESIIYQAEVTSQTTRETYTGLCDTAFKLSSVMRQRVSNFRLYCSSKKFQMLRKNVKSLLEQFQVCIFAEIVFGVRCTFNT